jgi:hypothetical protein
MSDADSTCGSAMMLDSQNFGQDRGAQSHTLQLVVSASTYRKHRDQMMACTETSRTSVSTPQLAIHSNLRGAACTKCSKNGFVVDDGID